MGSGAVAGLVKNRRPVRFASDQVLVNADPYFNNIRLGVISSYAVGDTLIDRDPATNEYSHLATSWKWSCARVFPTCLGPIRLTILADSRASSSSGIRCLGRYGSASAMTFFVATASRRAGGAFTDRPVTACTVEYSRIAY